MKKMKHILSAVAFCASMVLFYASGPAVSKGLSTAKGVATCQEATPVDYSVAFAGSGSTAVNACPVIIQAEFYQPGGTKWIDKKMRQFSVFQCVPKGGQGKSILGLTGDYGDFFCISKKNEDFINSLQKGDQLEITGRTATIDLKVKVVTVFQVSKVTKLDGDSGGGGNVSAQN